MKIRCIQLIDSGGKVQQKSNWLTIGKTYHVFSVFFGADGRRLLRLVGDGRNGVALFQWECFEVVSVEIPPTWIIDSGAGGWTELTPKSWAQSGFWERYYDGNSDARATFDKERREIIESDP